MGQEAVDWPPQFLQLSPFRWERTGAGRKGRLSMLRSSSSLLLRACLGHLDSGTRFGQGCCSCGPALCQVPCPGDEAGVASGSVSAPGLDCTAHPVLDLGLSLGDVEGGPRGRARLPSLVPQRSWVSWCSSASGVSVQALGQSSRGLCVVLLAFPWRPSELFSFVVFPQNPQRLDFTFAGRKLALCLLVKLSGWTGNQNGCSCL